MKSFLNTFLFLILCLFGFPINAQEAQIDSLFSQVDDDGPGIAVAVYKDGKLFYNKSFGQSNMDYGLQINNQTTFEVGGLSMHVTAACVLKLEDMGKLQLDDKVSKYLKDLPDYTEGNITINHLLNHTSGVMDYLVALGMTGHVWESPYNSTDAYELIKKNTKLGFRPGTMYEYSNSNYALLGKLIHEVSDTTLNGFAKEYLFDPLGMASTFYYDNAKAIVKNRATGYVETDSGYEVNQSPFFTSVGEGRLYTSLTDLMKWSEALEEGTHPVMNAEERLLERGLLNNGTKISYALGVQHGVEKGYAFYAHSGYWDGFSAMFLKIPEVGFWALTLSNNGSISGPNMAYSILDQVVEQNPETRIQKPYKLSKKALEKYTGSFITYRNGYLRSIEVENDTLVYKEFEGRSFKLMPIAKDRFKLMGSITDYSVQFTLEKGMPTKMDFMRNGIVNYRYEAYEPMKGEVDVQSYYGKYKNEDLNVIYELKKDEEEGMAIFVGEERIMNYLPVMDGLFCSKSTHHGYLKFSEDKMNFVISDYSFRPLLFEKLTN